MRRAARVPSKGSFALRRACHGSEDTRILAQGRRSRRWTVPADAGRRAGKKRLKTTTQFGLRDSGGSKGACLGRTVASWTSV